MNNDDLKIYMTYSVRAILLGLTFLFALKVGMLDGLLGLDEDKKPTVKVEKPVVEKVEAPKKVEKVKETPKLPQKGVVVYYTISQGDFTSDVKTIHYENRDSCAVALIGFEMGLKPIYHSAKRTQKSNIAGNYKATFVAKETEFTTIPDVYTVTCSE